MNQDKPKEKKTDELQDYTCRAINPRVVARRIGRESKFNVLRGRGYTRGLNTKKCMPTAKGLPSRRDLIYKKRNEK